MRLKQLLTSPRKGVGDNSTKSGRPEKGKHLSFAGQLNCAWLKLYCLNPSRVVLTRSYAFMVL
jgi:hypothetical protein